MKTMQERLATVERHIRENRVRVMIIGLGSVGTYLLDYLVSRNDPALEIVVVGRNPEKMQKKVNIVRVAALIRGLNRTHVTVEGDVDLDNVDEIRFAIKVHRPDFIVNSSRAYPGLKYGSISWANVRAYGIWTPLAIRFTKNIMEACEAEDTDAIVINTSYSDAVIPWLKSAGRAYPDFGSGNLNHLVPRMQFAVAEKLGVRDFWNVEIMFAAGHFHDVCISKEGHTEEMELPLQIKYRGEVQNLSAEYVFRACKIPMPVDQTRNMMNASSNYRIICAIIDVVRAHADAAGGADAEIPEADTAAGVNPERADVQKLFIPGFDGEIGGYPVCVGYRDGTLCAWIDESVFSYEEMNRTCRASMALDGVEDVTDGTLIYTDELIRKAKKAFGVPLPKRVAYDEIEQTAQFIIREIITPQMTEKT